MKKLGREASQRKHLVRNLVISLILHERIKTSLPKAKEARRAAEKIITLARRGDQHARLQAKKKLNNREACKKLFEELGPRFEDRPGGYTRILKLGPRRGDGSFEAILELVD